jgi:hypothetical protein
VGAPIILSLDIDGIFASQEPLQFAVRPSVVGVPLEAVIESTDGSAPRQVVSLASSDVEWIRRQISHCRPASTGSQSVVTRRRLSR